MARIIKCPFNPDRLDIPDDNIGQNVMKGIRRFADKVALIDVSNGREVTGTELANKVELISAGLLSLGCGSGDVVALFGQNSLEWIEVLISTMSIDCVPAGINHLLKEDELAIHLTNCKPKILFCDQSVAEIAVAAVNKVKAQSIQIIVSASNDRCISLKDLMSNAKKIESKATKPRHGKDECVIMFSSGTTGIQKPVSLSHENLLLEGLIALHPITRFVFDKPIAFAPMSHVAGLLLTVYGLIRGSTVFVMPRYELELFIDTVIKYKISDLFVVPPIATQLAKTPLLEGHNIQLNSIIIGAAPLGKEIELQLYERFPGVKIRQMYGMTELTGGSTMIPATIYKQSKEGSIGLPVFNTEMKVIDINSGEILPSHSSGEVCVRSPLIMLGYVNNKEATLQMIDQDGWIHTGDVGYYDENGYFYITDRIKELIKYNAFQVAPAELESVLLSHHDVADAAVIGIPHPDSGEVPMAVVVLKSTAKITELQLTSYVNDKVAGHKKLRGGVKFVTSIPRTGSGKILRREIKAQLLTNKL